MLLGYPNYGHTFCEYPKNLNAMVHNLDLNRRRKRLRKAASLVVSFFVCLTLLTLLFGWMK